MKRFSPVLFVVSVLFVLSVPSSANVFNLGPGLTNLETVPVGDPGNAADTAAHSGNPAGQGSVSYTYNIGKYEVTAGQYCDFLNKVAATDTYGLYNTYMWSDTEGCKIARSGASGNYIYSVAADWANRPVNFVSFWDSLRFANWLNNGQPTGPQDLSTTEDGAYFLNGENTAYGLTIHRSASWKWAVTSEDEWYKAAFYKSGGTNRSFWDYPTTTNTPPLNVGADGYNDLGNHANYFKYSYTIGSPYYRTNVGEFERSAGPYGTFDQGGNVWEWNEGIPKVDTYAYRGIRGGSFQDTDDHLSAFSRSMQIPVHQGVSIGFRVVQAVPEPSSLMILAGGLGMLLGIRRRRV